MGSSIYHRNIWVSASVCYMRGFLEVMPILEFTIGNANEPAGPGLNCSILNVDLKAEAMSHPELVLKES